MLAELKEIADMNSTNRPLSVFLIEIMLRYFEYQVAALLIK
jgi:hypothetical protein